MSSRLTFSVSVLGLYVTVIMPTYRTTNHKKGRSTSHTAYRTTAILLTIKRQIDQLYCLPYNFHLLIPVSLLLALALASPFFLTFLYRILLEMRVPGDSGTVDL